MEKCPKCNSKVAKEVDKKRNIVEIACENCNYYTSKQLNNK